MAQKTEKEETEFKVPETLGLCVNNCGVTGNPATNNMCQKCFNASTATSISSNTAMTTTSTAVGGNSSPGAVSTTTTKASATTNVAVSGGGIMKFSAEKQPRSSPSRSPAKDLAPEAMKPGREKADAASGARKEVNRCSGCKRKVGLTGFRCRCGELFCWEHRYSDRHDCSYDYKSAGRDAIARENPVVKAAKIVRV